MTNPFIDVPSFTGEREFDWDEYTRYVFMPWRQIPQYRILTGQTPWPYYSKESVAGSLTTGFLIWQVGLSTRAIVANFVAQRYMLPVQTKVMIATAPIWLYAVNRDIIESAPEEEQPSLWRGFAQALTGTGPGVGGWNPGY